MSKPVDELGLMQRLPHGFAKLDANRRVLAVDAVAASLLGRGRDALIGHHLEELELYRPELTEFLAQLAQNSEVIEHRIYRVGQGRQGQERRDVRLYFSARIVEDQHVDVMIRRAVRVPTEVDRDQQFDPERAVEQLERLTPLFEASGIGVAVLDGKLNTLFETTTWANIRANEVRVERDASDFAVKPSTATGQRRIVERTIRLVDGSVFNVVETEFLDSKGARHRIGLAWDTTQLWDAYETIKDQATELARLNEEIRDLAMRDGLTGIYNRRYLEDRVVVEVERAARYTSPLAVIFFDIDGFKDFNDTFGHVAGDQALRAIADLVSGRMRRTDVLARFGGEEFAILLPETSLRRAVAAAESLRAQIAMRQWPHRTITASFGVAAYRDGDTALDLMDRVDRAMYAAKRAGRNRLVVVEPDGSLVTREAMRRPDGER